MKIRKKTFTLGIFIFPHDYMCKMLPYCRFIGYISYETKQDAISLETEA